ncbi:MAG: ribonuclease Z [Bacteroidaceae bacterium]|nr:ribonuclease Z [Bacteroidaceae bacterium]
MEPFTLHILGCGSAKPSNGHLPTCQVLDLRGKLFMIDCGEGAQMQWSRMGLGMTRLGHIFISHIHGDHCFGLPGLISTMGLLGRTADLHIHAPADLQPFVECVLKNFCTEMDYEVFFHVVDTKQFQLIFEDRSVEVWSLPLRHRTPCSGFLFKEKPLPPHIRPEMLEAYGIPVSQINNIKAGLGWVNEDGELIPSERLTRPAEPPRSYAYCSDTMYKPSLAELIKGVNLLFHEATFGEEYVKRAQQTGHSTARQAGMMAKAAGAKQLVIGHYSGRVKDEVAHLNEAKAEFENTELAKEGKVFTIHG